VSNFKEELLNCLEEEFDVGPRTIADGMAQVIRGETVKKRLALGPSGDMAEVSREITTTPKDIVNGAMIYDALRGGDLGISPRSIRSAAGAKQVEVVHRRLGVDTRIIANQGEDPVFDAVFELEEDIIAPTNGAGDPFSVFGKHED